MRSEVRVAATLAVVVALVASTPLATADRGQSGPAQQEATQQTGTLLITQEFRLTPETPGSVEVVRTYTIPNGVEQLRAAIRPDATVVDLDGMLRENETRFRWTGVTRQAQITYTLPVNRTTEGGHAGVNGTLLSVDAGEWALFRRPRTPTSYQFRPRSPVTTERRTFTAGPGATGTWLVVLGEVDTYHREANGQTFELVVPEAANLTEAPGDILTALGRASGDLDVGDRDESVFVVAAPSDGVPWAVRGLQTGDSDFWVLDRARLDTPENIWIHEYVHTRQRYRPTNETRWTVEGFASYYAALYAFEETPVRFDAFRARLAQGNASRYANVTLAAPETWVAQAAYDRGALVAGEMDRRIRLASGGERTLDEVVRAMNRESGPVTNEVMLEAVATTGNDSVRATVDNFTTTSTPVDAWNRSAHIAAFGSMPARMQYALPSGTERDDYRVTGPYRTANLTRDGPLSLTTGERLVVEARVRNVGGETGDYEVALTVNGSVVSTVGGRLAAGHNASVPTGYTFDQSGTYVASIGNDSRFVRVREPAEATVRALTISATSVEQYQSATVNVTVATDAPRPAASTITLERGGQAVGTRTVPVPPNGSSVASFSVTFPTPGEVDVALPGTGVEPITVVVERSPISTSRPTVTPTESQTPTPSPTPTDATSVDGGGPGMLAALVALVLAVRWLGRD